jgi:hypothetical protein
VRSSRRGCDGGALRRKDLGRRTVVAHAAGQERADVKQRREGWGELMRSLDPHPLVCLASLALWRPCPASGSHRQRRLQRDFPRWVAGWSGVTGWKTIWVCTIASRRRTSFGRPANSHRLARNLQLLRRRRRGRWRGRRGPRCLPAGMGCVGRGVGSGAAGRADTAAAICCCCAFCRSSASSASRCFRSVSIACRNLSASARALSSSNARWASSCSCLARSATHGPPPIGEFRA